MKFYVYDVQKGKGYWRPNFLGYTHDYKEAGVFSADELPSHAADCWIAIPQFVPYHSEKPSKPNLRAVEDLKRARSKE